MKTTLLLIRHGFSTSNEDATLTGQSDAPLTPLGRLQGDAASRYLLEKYKIDAVYSSDLSRAVDTAKLAIPGCEPIQLPLLREISIGGLTGEYIAAVREKYGNLKVRVSGYSATFTTLPTEHQDEIIMRTVKR